MKKHWIFLVTMMSLFQNIMCDQVSECMYRADECYRDPANNARGPICGSDNHTYRTICTLLSAQCQNPRLTKLSDGECSEPKPCLQSLQYAKSTLEKGMTGLLIPKCRKDGMYAAVQCQESGSEYSTRYCWCVTPEGIAVPNTTVRIGRPHCGHHKRKEEKPGKTKPSRRVSRGGGRKQRQGCKTSDKKAFNANLIKIFKSEWTRAIQSRPEQRTEMEIDRIVLDWKFTKMDRNLNDVLEVEEYNDLKRAVKKNVKPKRCARQFTRTCDLDKNQDISRHEWVECLSRNAIDDNTNTQSWSSQDRSGSASIDELEEDEEPIDDGRKNIDELRHPRVLQSVPTSEPAFSEEVEDPPVEGDCLYDRKANEHQSGTLYVPECTLDGRYKPIQCYTNYCWCVNPDTGKVISGTISKGTMPKCTDIPSYSRTMKGCSDSRKLVFLKDLTEFFVTKMGVKVDTGQKATEKAALWSFNFFDKNRSKVLEKKEWKVFRDMIEPKKQLRHCGKKLPRYCDVNGDKKITLDEWNNCLGVSSGASVNSKPAIPREKKINPLESILKSD